MWVGETLCLRRNEVLHRRLAKIMWDKMCTCGGTESNCALNNVKEICSDFETGLWRLFSEELQTHQQ